MMKRAAYTVGFLFFLGAWTGHKDAIQAPCAAGAQLKMPIAIDAPIIAAQFDNRNGRFQQVRDMVDRLLPAWSLSPRVHFYAAWSARQLNDHEDAEHALNRDEVFFLLSFGVGFDPVDKKCADQRDDDRNCNREYVAVGQADVQANVFKAFENGDQRDRERRKEDIYGHVTLGLRQRVFLAQDESLD